MTDKRARLLPTGEPRTVVLPLRLSPTERDILEIAAKDKGIGLSTYVTIYALQAACEDVDKITGKNYSSIVEHIRNTVKTVM